MTPSIYHCAIWPEFEAKQLRHPTIQGDHIESNRAGGAYCISYEAGLMIRGLSDSKKALLTTWLINQRLQGVPEPEVTKEVLAYIETVRPLSVQARAERLLRFVAIQATDVGTGTSVETRDGGSLAWSESIGGHEARYFYSYLQEKGWISGHITGGGFSGVVTVDGYARLAESEVTTVFSQAFVAMWFDNSMDDAFDNGIAPAIEAAGYQPFRIDRKPDVVKIDDEIIAGIRGSRILVADFTQYAREARGGVYFEAGFAMGLGIPVIFMCRADCVEYLHFDTRQYNHIVWENPEQLRVDLLNRIRARIGQGPLRADQGA